MQSQTFPEILKISDKMPELKSESMYECNTIQKPMTKTNKKNRQIPANAPF